MAKVAVAEELTPELCQKARELGLIE